MSETRRIWGPGACVLGLARFAAVMLISASAWSASGSTGDTQQFGGFHRPFAKTSPWNSRPVNPRFGDFVIPEAEYVPRIAEGAWATAAFLAEPGDPPMTIDGLHGQPGLWQPDAEAYGSVKIPRWPADVVPASGSDGHADIVDPEAGIIHSFYKLRRDGDGWVAAQYAWTRLDGRGWGDPAHYFQGARAAAVPTIGGLIRKHEIDDGDTMYRHALAMSLTFNGLSPDPTYVFPATSADRGAEETNSGTIPQGALMMFPPDFDVTTIRTPALRKVAETLKVYGAYVVDRNHGTPFAIYVENGSGFNLHAGGWNSVAAADLQRMRRALRQVVAVDGWLDGEGAVFEQTQNLNLLSMRGPWRRVEGDRTGAFDSWKQSVVFPQGVQRVVQTNGSGRSMQPVHWAVPKVGSRYRLIAKAEGGASLRLRLVDGGSTLFDSGELGDGQAVEFNWPAGNPRPVVYAISGTEGPSSVRGDLRRAP